MVMAEISIVPVGTGRTGVSFYVARALESVSDIEGLRCHLNAMGTVLESEDIGTVMEAAKTMIATLHNLGVARVNAMLKIDSRLDKQDTAAGKVEAVRRHLDA
jgi:uncharacterized protein (TIGR00106 family)